MMSSLKRLGRRSKTAIIANKILMNWRMRRDFSIGTKQVGIGSTHSQKSIAESLQYIATQYLDYCRYANLDPSKIKGKRILELGCGDNIGVALRFLADCAAQVICVDKFYAVRDAAKERLIYIALRNSLSSAQRDAFDTVVNLDNAVVPDLNRLCCVYGIDLARFVDDEALGLFDVVISRAVIEEIYNPEPVFSAVDKLLKPGGMMLHKIDLSDYGIFSNGGMNPLTFLTIPEWLYRRMASESAIPNRKLRSYYRGLTERLGYEVRILVSSVIGFREIVPHKEALQLDVDYGADELSLIEAIRPKLQKQFAVLPDEELLVSGIFLIARKPLERSVVQ